MSQRLFLVCLLVAVCVQLLEAKSASHRRTVHKSLLKRLLSHSRRQTTQCEGQFQCADGVECLYLHWVCDGDEDCDDGSDETEDCPSRVCPDGYVKCSSGQCIETSRYCSGTTCANEASLVVPFDCPKTTPRPRAVCNNATQFHCQSANRCISREHICDGDNDCGDLSDESNCDELKCTDDEVSCNSGQCLRKSSICTGWTSATCRDGTDLSTVCLDYTCTDGDFKCHSNGRCIFSTLLCNGRENCPDGSDESDTVCPPKPCDAGTARCPERSKCISTRFFCDTDNDCGDNSDEDPEFCSTRDCDEGELKCANGQCLKIDGFCRNEYSCRDGSLSPNDVSLCATVQCDAGTARCPTRNKCINTRYFCDADNDCGDSSDEAPELCSNRQCEENEVRCANGQCIGLEGFCSEQFTCRDGSRSSDDPALCKPIECDPGTARCPGRKRCINTRYFCDTDNDCGDNSDEAPELCQNRVCGENEVKCANGQCINLEGFCSGMYRCRDSSLTIDSVLACGSPTPEPTVPDVSFYMAQYQCMSGVQSSCGEPSIAQQFNREPGQSETEIVGKIAEADLGEICSSIQTWRTCALTSYNNSEHCQLAEQLNPELKQQKEFALNVLDFVCVQHLEVINRGKSCLLKLNEQGQPVMMFKLMMSCAADIMSHQSSSPREPYCISRGLQQCVKNVIAEECGDDVALVADELANMVQELCKQETSPEQTAIATSAMKRHAREMAMMKKMLRSVF